MEDALYGMRTPLEALALRRRNLAPDGAVAPGARALLGQAEVVPLVEVAAVIVVGFVIYTVVVHLIVDKHRTKRRPAPVPDAPAEPEATGMPMATSVPTTTA